MTEIFDRRGVLIRGGLLSKADHLKVNIVALSLLCNTSTYKTLVIEDASPQY